MILAKAQASKQRVMRGREIIVEKDTLFLLAYS